jgi:hypothetical protein
MPRSLVRRTLFWWTLAVAVLAIAGCAGGAGSSGGSASLPSQPSGVPKPSASGGSLSDGALRVSLIDQLGPLWYCDRDSYPVARDEQAAALAGYATMAADTAVFPAVAAKLGIDPASTPTDAQKLSLYQLWKSASAVSLDPDGSDRFRFDYLAQPVEGASQGTRTQGTIDSHGVLTIEQQAPANAPMCPICLSIGTLIRAPSGAFAVDRLRIGDVIWTLDRGGRRVTGSVIAIGSTPAPAGHRVIRLTLADGRSVTASLGHPLADGRTMGDLHVGDTVDGSAVTGVDNLAYAGGATYDLVVSGETGIYLAGGIPLRSTLR